jgi:CRP-like cAMP-binding protein
MLFNKGKVMTIESTIHSILQSPCREPRTLSEFPGLAQTNEAIADHPFFAGIDDLEIEFVTDVAETAHFEPDETLFRRGDPGDSVMLVLSGRVRVESHRSSGELLVMNVIEPGELVGEMAVLEGTTRSATVTALEPCEVLVIPHSEFLALLVNHPGLIVRMLGTATDRLRNLTDRVVELT